MNKQISVIREALESALSDDQPYIEKCKQALTALAQIEAMVGEQEPFAYVYSGIRFNGELHGPHLIWNPREMDAMSAQKGAKAEPLYTAAPVAQQPQAEAVPPDVVRDADVEAAAKKMAEIFDYPWDFMPEKGRNTMRENVRAVLDAAIAQQKGQP